MSGMGIKCLHAGTQHIVGLFDLVYSIQENVIASLHCADLTYPFCDCKIQRKTKQEKKREREKRRKAEMMSLCQVYCNALQLLFAGAETVKPLLSLFSYFSVYPHPSHPHPTPTHHSPHHLSCKFRNHLIPNKNRTIKRNPANVTPPHTHTIMITSM